MHSHLENKLRLSKRKKKTHEMLQKGYAKKEKEAVTHSRGKVHIKIQCSTVNNIYTVINI
jgi:hypothetical protein